MRSYWLKIVLGALGVFAIGMIIATAARRLRHVAETDSDIVFPLAFLPFRVEGERLGEFNRVRIVRATPDSVTAVHVRVELDDSAAAARLRNCLPVIRDLQHIDNNTTFRCAAPTDTARQDLMAFGTVELSGTGDRLQLLVPRSEVGAAQSTDAGWERAAEYADSVAEAVEDRADSVAEAAEALADSLSDAEMARADSIREAGMRLADSIRAARGVPAPQ